MWFKVKALAGAVGLALLGYFGFMWQRAERKRVEDELADEQAAREVEARGHRATLEGLQRENEIREKKDPDRAGPRPDDFS